MKTRKTLLVLTTLCFVISISFFISGCSKKDSKDTTSKTDCLVGLWSATESNFTKTFNFKSDNTGIEVQSASDIRNYTWQIKDDKPTIVYDGESTEWQFILDCDNNTLNVLGLVYKK